MSLPPTTQELLNALAPFAASARDLEGEPDDEWAKFRWSVRDYRRAHAVFVRLAGQEPPYGEDVDAYVTANAP